MVRNYFEVTEREIALIEHEYHEIQKRIAAFIADADDFDRAEEIEQWLKFIDHK